MIGQQAPTYPPLPLPVPLPSVQVIDVRICEEDESSIPVITATAVSVTAESTRPSMVSIDIDSENVRPVEPPAEREECISNETLWLITTVYTIFIIAGDFYFATTDKSCVRKSYSGLNMSIYLLLNGTHNCILLPIKIYLAVSPNQCVTNAMAMAPLWDWAILLNYIFTIAWLIVGCTLFWKNPYDTICSLETYTYINLTLIVKIMVFAISNVR